MNFKVLVCVLMVIELSHVIDGKRSFGITGRRNKSKSPSVRRGQHGHDGDDHIPVPKPPPSHHDTKKASGWNTNQQSHSTAHHTPSAPPAGPQLGASNQGGLYNNNNMNRGPPPPYTSHGYGAAPPAYGSHTANYGVPPPSYGSAMGYGHQQPMFGGGHSPYGGGMPMMGAPVMMMPAGGNYNRGSGLGSGIMTNLFAGLAGYQLAKAFSGGSHHSRDREVIILDNRQLPANADGTAAGVAAQPLPAGPITNPSAPQAETAPQQQQQQHLHQSSSTEIPQLVTQITPANNEYNYWGLPQYGIPLYGFNLPAQITDYYKVETFTPSAQNQQFPH